jgi:hypothetical protein
MVYEDYHLHLQGRSGNTSLWNISNCLQEYMNNPKDHNQHFQCREKLKLKTGRITIQKISGLNYFVLYTWNEMRHGTLHIAYLWHLIAKILILASNYFHSFTEQPDVHQDNYVSRSCRGTFKYWNSSMAVYSDQEEHLFQWFVHFWEGPFFVTPELLHNELLPLMQAFTMSIFTIYCRNFEKPLFN